MHISSKGRTFISILAAIALWQLVSVLVGQSILLCSPFDVVKAFVDLCITAVFWQTVFHSLLRIALGFILAFVFGMILAFASYMSKWIRSLLQPYVVTIRTVPVASFIIIALIWVRSSNLSVLIPFLMCFPVIYSNILSGLDSTDTQMIQMADVFGFSFFKRVKYIYIPTATPYIESACATATGLSWKSGIAAEVIGLAPLSIGEKLYNAKIYFDTADLFAWTVTIVALSIICEKVVGLLLKFIFRTKEA